MILKAITEILQIRWARTKQAALRSNNAPHADQALSQLNLGRRAEVSQDERLRVVDHLWIFHAPDNERMFATVEDVGDEIVQAIGD